MSLKETESAKFERLLHRITNEKQLLKFINSIQITESQLKEELDTFIGNTTHVKEARKIELSRTELATSLNTSSDLVDLLSNGGSVASKITARVRLLDAERSRVKETAEYVTKVKNLRGLILTIHSAIDQRDWETVARSIDSIRQLPLTGDYINNVVPSADVPESPEIVVNKWIEELTNVFTTEFNKAAETRDVTNLTKFFSYFPLIGKENIGLDCYSKFICTIVANQSRSIITNQPQQDKIGFYPAALMRLLEIVSTILNQHSKIIINSYGKSHMIGIIERVQRETDAQAGLLSDTFYDKRNIYRLLDEVSTYKFPYLRKIANSTQTNARNSPVPGQRDSFDNTRLSEDGFLSVVEIGDITTEFSSLLHYWSLYCRFISIKWNEYQDIQDEELTLPKAIVESKFTKKIQSKLLPALETLLTFYVRRSLEQAFQLEELPGLDELISQPKILSPEIAPISSLVEDFILILSNSLKQAVQTGQPLTLKNMVVHIRKIIDNDYLLIISRRLKDLYPRSGTVLTASSVNVQIQHQQKNTMGSIFQRGANALNQISSADETKLHTFIILLNSLNLGSIYFDKIIKQQGESLSKNYPFGSDTIKLESIIFDLGEHYTTVSNNILDENISILFNQTLKNRLKILLTDSFKDSDYLISSFDEEENSVAQRFVRQWNSLIIPYIKVLDSKIYDRLLATIVSTLSGLLERKLWSLENNVNELGSIKLERDYSGIIGEVTKNRYNLRDKFLRVTQIIMILGFDNEDDEIDMNWVLTPSERQSARSLRV